MTTKPRRRNKDQSKQQILWAVGEILKNNGYAALGINSIASIAGLDKKLIYNYFGGLEGLLDEYVKTQDFWSNVKEKSLDKEIADGGNNFMKGQLEMQMQFMDENIAFQKILLWRLSEERESLKKLGVAQEENGEILLKNISDPYFNENASLFRAIMAITISGLYYINLSSKINANTFCGIDYNTEEGKKLIKAAKDFMVDQAYQNLKK